MTPLSLGVVAAHYFSLLKRSRGQSWKQLLTGFAQWGVTSWALVEVAFWLYYLRRRAKLESMQARSPPLENAREHMQKCFDATEMIHAQHQSASPPSLLLKSEISGSLVVRRPSFAGEAGNRYGGDGINVENLLRTWEEGDEIVELSAGGESARRPSVGDETMCTPVALTPSPSMVLHADLKTLKHAEISGWFFGAEVNSLKKENVEEWLAWALFHNMPGSLTVEQKEEMKCIYEDTEKWAEVTFPMGYNKEVRSMRLTMDPIPSIHRPLVYYVFTAGVFNLVTRMFMASHKFQLCRSGTLWYWHRSGTNSTDAKADIPLVFCHGLGVGNFIYMTFINALVTREPNRELFLLDMPHISMSIDENVPSRAQTIACVSDMLAAWAINKAHFVGHSFGSIVVAWMLLLSASHVSHATFVDPVCFLLVKPDIAFNFMYREPTKVAELLIWYFVARELHIAHSLGRHFFWHQNLIWPDQINVPCLVALSGQDAIVPAHSVRRYLSAVAPCRPRHAPLHLIWFPKSGHGDSMYVDVSAVAKVVSGIVSLEKTNGSGEQRELL